jgi:putative ABC transport system substrate-binding protein
MDVIVTAGGQATRAAKEATSTIPIVMTNDPDPVGSGFVANLATAWRKRYRLVHTFAGV